MKQLFTTSLALTGAVAALGLSVPTLAQDGSREGDEDFASASEEAERERGRGRVVVQPYIEASQVLVAEISPGDDVLTYTQLAAGVDVSVTGRNNGASASLRYEKNIAGNDGALDSDSLSGVARGYATIAPQVLTLEAGGLAARTRVDGTGGTSPNPIVDTDRESRIYSAYAGPNVHTEVGAAVVNANYRIGYTKVEAPDAVIVAPGADPVDVFDDSLSQNAAVHVATRPGDPLPVGLGVGAGWRQEDLSNLDQRVRDMYVRGDVTVPVSPSLAVVGGIGYEDVEVSSRDALRDDDGDPIIGDDGRLVTDTSQPRQIAYEAEGLIWDVGVLWRPSSRTSLAATVGRRYDSTTYYGSFAYAPSVRSSVNISVYDTVSGFGGLLTDALVALPTEFTASRNPLTGDINGCVQSLQGGNCVTGALGSIRSSTFRSRGIAASYARQFGRLSAGIGAGYNEREFIAGEGTVLASADGLTDESYYITGYLGTQIGRDATLSTNAYASWTDSEFVNAGGSSAVGASATYGQRVYRGLSARAAVAIDHFESDVAEDDITAASALLGLRYDF